jgi:hypothetical protein
LLLKQQRFISNLRWIERSILEDNRWSPVFVNHVKQIADRVDALGAIQKE